MVPVKLNASVLEAHVHRQVLRVTVGLLYRADACLMRFQEVRPLLFAVWGQSPLTGEYAESDPTRVPFPERFYSSALQLFMYSGALCVQQHRPSSAYEYRFGNGRERVKLRQRYGLDIRGMNTSTYIRSLIRISKL